MTADLTSAEQTERELREQVNTLARARAHATSEGVRLRALAARPDADASLEALADRYEQQGATLDAELALLRNHVEQQRVLVEQLRAEAAGA